MNINTRQYFSSQVDCNSSRYFILAIIHINIYKVMCGH